MDDEVTRRELLKQSGAAWTPSFGDTLERLRWLKILNNTRSHCEARVSDVGIR